jgi:hypothetical protein
VALKENPHLRTVTNADGAAILDVEAGRISILNATGSEVWQALGRGKDFKTIAEDLARETGADIAEIEKDLREFIDRLRKQNLLG